MVKFVNDSRHTRVAVISATDASGQAGYRGLMHGLPLYKNVSLVDDQKFAPSSITAAAEVAHVKATQPQAVFVFATGPAFAVVSRGLKDAGMEVPVITSSANYNAALLAQYADFLPRDLLFDGFPFQGGRPQDNRALRKSYDDFTQAFKTAGVAPTSLSAYAWDPADIVVQALRALGPDASAEQIRNYILDLHGHAGICGIYDFRRGDQHGLGNDSTVLVRWDAKSQTGSAVTHPGGAPL
jgi:branched-chain amino acid transport system substrate-binding protein